MSALTVCPCCASAVEAPGVLCDPVQGLVSRGNKIVQLRPTEFRLLQRLIEGYPSAVPRADLLTAMLGDTLPRRMPKAKTLDVHITHVRRHCDVLGLMIETRLGVGYAVRFGTAADAAVLRQDRFGVDQHRRGSLDTGDHALIAMLAARGLSALQISEKVFIKLSAVEAVLAERSDRLAS